MRSKNARKRWRKEEKLKRQVHEQREELVAMEILNDEVSMLKSKVDAMRAAGVHEQNIYMATCDYVRQNVRDEKEELTMELKLLKVNGA